MAEVDNPIALTLGSLELHGGLSEDDYTISVLSDDATWGNPQPVEVAVQTLLQQGSKVVTDRYDNREVFLRVEVAADDGVSLAEGEAALFAELGKPNLLTWTPPKEFAPPSVFRVITSSMDFGFDDLGELYGLRVYGVRLICEPFARSATEFVVDAAVTPVEGGGTPIDLLVDDASSTSGWSSWYGRGSIAVSTSGSTLFPATSAPFSVLKRTGTVGMSTTPILVLDIKTVPSLDWHKVSLSFNGGAYQAASAVGASPTTSTGYQRFYFECPVATISSFAVGADFGRNGDGRIYVAEVRKRNNPPATGTLRQKFFTASVPGSAPAQATLEISHPTSGLGQMLVHSSPVEGGQSFAPSLLPYLVSSAPVIADASTVSGGTTVISSSPNVYRIPAAQVAPSTFEVGCWVMSNVAGAVRTLTATATMRDAAGNLIGGQVDLSTTYTFAAANIYYYVTLGRLQLPSLRVSPTSTALVQLQIQALSGTVTLDEAYLFDVDRGALTRLDAGTKTRVWIKSATVDLPMPSISVGTLEDESDAVAAGSAISAWGTHETTPPGVNVLVVSRTALDANVRVRGYAAHHTHATE